MTVRAPLPHDAAQLHVTGQARYVDDIPTPANAVHLAFGLSPIAAGPLVSLDLAAVRAAPGVIGARMTGAGFGGCTVNLVEPERVAEFIAAVGPAYQRRSGLRPDFYEVHPADGA